MAQVAITGMYGEVWNQLLYEKCLVMPFNFSTFMLQISGNYDKSFMVDGEEF